MHNFIFIKIIFLSFFIITTAQSEGVYFKKFFEEKKENYIANQNIKKLNEELKDTNTQKDKLIKELEEVNTQYSELDNVKIIQITRLSGLIFFSSIIILVLIILYLSLTINRQRKWRKEFYDENNNKFIGLLPERIAETIDKIEKEYENLQKNNRIIYDNFDNKSQQIAKLINDYSQTNTSNVSQINEQLSELRKFNDEKNALVKKYQEFYDLSVLKSFIFEIISAIDNLEDSIKQSQKESQAQSSIDAMMLAKDQLVILLENENILLKEPNLQLKYNDPKQPIRLKVMKSIETDNDNLVANIYEIIHAGYAGLIGKNNEEKLIRESYVSIYIAKKKEEN